MGRVRCTHLGGRRSVDHTGEDHYSVKAANVDVEPYWPDLFAKALEGIDVKSLITNVGSGVGSGPAAGSGAAAGAPVEEKKEEEAKKEESSDESDEDGFWSI